MNKGQRKYNVALFIIASANVALFHGGIGENVFAGILAGVGLGYGLFNRWKWK